MVGEARRAVGAGAGDITIKPSTRPRIAWTAPANLGALAVRARDQEVEPAFLRQLVDPADQLGVELAVEVGEEHPDDVGLLAREGTSRRVREEAEASGDFARDGGSIPRPTGPVVQRERRLVTDSRRPGRRL